ncbi:MAG TPA: glycine zipper family protein [Opitutaceae bacterium]|nr:glycine zipper family protein [Opitutaceae bacterium]
MKMPFCLALALLTVAPARAQIFGSNATGGALLGGLAGGIIGYNNHNQTGRGIAIGAASGLILGSFADQARYNAYQQTQVPVPSSYYVYRQAPAYYYQTPASYSSDYYGDDYGYERPNYMASGALLGGLAGGIIGYNNHHQTGRGILIGTASGLILGSLAEHAAREREAAAATPVIVTTAPVAPPAPEAPAAPAAPPAAAAPASPMSSANSLFGRN